MLKSKIPKCQLQVLRVISVCEKSNFQLRSYAPWCLVTKRRTTDERLAAQNTPLLAASPMVKWRMRHVWILYTAVQRLNSPAMHPYSVFYRDAPLWWAARGSKYHSACCNSYGQLALMRHVCILYTALQCNAWIASLFSILLWWAAARGTKYPIACLLQLLLLWSSLEYLRLASHWYTLH